jgi:Coenzyme PQQ synthesis protein D (PqqD)
MPRQLVQQNAAVETAPLQQDAILFHSGQNRFCILNRTSSFIWNKLQSPVTAEQIAQELSANFEGVTPTDALRDVNAAIEKLIELDLVVTRPCD